MTDDDHHFPIDGVEASGKRLYTCRHKIVRQRDPIHIHTYNRCVGPQKQFYRHAATSVFIYIIFNPF